jgi:cellulose synthase/poly-beta-1,6-N-acetylglucosamine synthase-like glycosyltransferase
MLAQLQHQFSSLRVINTDVQLASSLNLKGKTRALDQGIRQAEGEYILMTDADCTVSPTWIQSMAELFQNTDAALVAAFSLMKPTSFFAALQAVEWTHNHTLASAGVAWKQPLGCFGNNLAIKRSVYQELGGYSAIPFSVTEDLALLQAVHNSGQTITYRCSADTKIYTLPCETISEYIKQHHRWVNGARALGARQHVFVFTIFALWVGIFGSLYVENYLGAISLLILRMIADSFLIISSLRVLQDYRLIYFTPICTLCMAVIELFLPFLLLKPSVTWKGQVFSGK